MNYGGGDHYKRQIRACVRLQAKVAERGLGLRPRLNASLFYDDSVAKASCVISEPFTSKLPKVSKVCVERHNKTDMSVIVCLLQFTVNVYVSVCAWQPAYLEYLIELVC